MSTSYYKGKKVWITGASSGIGRALAIELSSYGAFLILSSRTMSKLEALKKELENTEKCILVALDMQNAIEIREKTENIIKAKGAIDILINNAGISQRSLVRNTNDLVDQSIIDTNLLGPIRHTKAILPTMLEQSYGHIVVMSSVTGKIGTPYRSSYAASKHGLHGFFDSLRAEESKNGIFVSIICPGYVSTDISVNALTAEGQKQGTKDDKSINGLRADIFAKKVLRKISKKQAEIVIGGKETLGIYLKRFVPSILRKILVNIKP